VGKHIVGKRRRGGEIKSKWVFEDKEGAAGIR